MRLRRGAHGGRHVSGDGRLSKCQSCGALLDGAQRCAFCQADLAPDVPPHPQEERARFENLVEALKREPDERAQELIELCQIPRDPSVALDMAQYFLKLSRSTSEKHLLRAGAAEEWVTSLLEHLAGMETELGSLEKKRLAALQKRAGELKEQGRSELRLGLFLFVLLPLGLVAGLGYIIHHFFWQP